LYTEKSSLDTARGALGYLEASPWCGQGEVDFCHRQKDGGDEVFPESLSFHFQSVL